MTCPESEINALHKLMRRFYRYLEQQGLARDFTSSLTVPKPKHETESEKKIVVWEDEEIERIFNGFSNVRGDFRIRFLIVLAYHTGCRISELLGLKYDDFSPEGLVVRRQLVRVPVFAQGKKTTYSPQITRLKSVRSYRTIPLNDDVLKELEIHKAWQKEDMHRNKYQTDYLFTTNSGAFYEKANIRRAATRYYKSVGVPAYGFHVYRHTFGTNLCRAGVPIQITSALMGHSDINVTARYYVQVSPAEKLDAVKRLERDKNSR